MGRCGGPTVAQSSSGNRGSASRRARPHAQAWRRATAVQHGRPGRGDAHGRTARAGSGKRPAHSGPQPGPGAEASAGDKASRPENSAGQGREGEHRPPFVPWTGVNSTCALNRKCESSNDETSGGGEKKQTEGKQRNPCDLLPHNRSPGRWLTRRLTSPHGPGRGGKWTPLETG